MRQPFTYLIGWSHLDRWYYGVRYANGCHTSDLWTTYFTSSTIVKEFMKEHGQPDIIQVRRKFDTEAAAIRYESRILSRLKVLSSDKWLNRNVAGAILMDDTTKGKIGTSMRGKVKSEEHRRKISEALKGRRPTNWSQNAGPKSEQTRQRIAMKMKGNQNAQKNTGCT
jgi:hypothetical protein